MKSFLRKLLSIKNWVAVWSMAMLSYMIIENKTDFLIIAQILCAVPLAYIGANVYQKKIFHDGELKGAQK